MLPVACFEASPCHTDNVPDDEDDLQELIRRSGDDLDEALATLGVHVDDKSVVGRETADGPAFAVALTGLLGPLAFSSQVQDPKGTEEYEQFEEIAEAIAEAEVRQQLDQQRSEFDRIRQQLSRQDQRDDPSAEHL